MFEHEFGDALVRSHQKLEQAAEREILSAWNENWLPCHDENPLTEKIQVFNVTELREQEGNEGMTDEDAIQASEAFFEKEDAKAFIDVNDVSPLNPKSLLRNLKKLRNFCAIDEDLTERELNLLKPGNIMLYKVDVPEFSYFFEGEKELKNGAVTLCFIKGKYGIVMHVLGEQGLAAPYSLVPKSWIYRSQATVFLSVDGACVNCIKFYSVEDAMKFEFNFMFVAEFSDKSTVIHLYGDFPKNQLEAKGVEGKDNYERHQLDILAKTASVNSEMETRPRSLNLSFATLMENVRSRIAEYVKNAYRLQVFLFQSCISFRFTKEIKCLLEGIIADFPMLLKIVIFCKLPTSSFQNSTDFPCNRSISELVRDIFQIWNNLRCCKLMHSVNVLYHEYLQKFADILTTVHGYIAKYQKGDDRMSNKEENEEPMEFDLIPKMRYYLEVGDAKCVELFNNVDETLRVGGTTIFDVLRKNLKTEFVQIIFNTKTIPSVSKDFFGDSYCSIGNGVSTGNDDEKHVRLSDLTERSEISFIENRNRLFMGECLVQQKVNKSAEMLQNFAKEIEGHLNFDLEEWLDLVSICRNITPENQEYLDVQSETDSQFTAITRTHPSTSDDDSFEKISFQSESDFLVFPKEWKNYNNYEKEEFEKVKNLGKGAYGTAKILKHKKLRQVVLKKYETGTSDVDRMKEINMLISLQFNQHITKLFGFYYAARADFGRIPDGILLEYIERNLYSFIHDRMKASFLFKHDYRFKTAIEQMKGMASAFAAMHKQRIMHRDIKPDNILLTYGDKIQVCDFGMCGSIDKTKKSNENIGTLRYASPEIHDQMENYTEKTDVFSLGVTMWEQIHRRQPYCKFKKNADIMDFVCDGNRLEFDETCLSGLKTIIEMAWALNAK